MLRANPLPFMSLSFILGGKGEIEIEGFHGCN